MFSVHQFLPSHSPLAALQHICSLRTTEHTPAGPGTNPRVHVHGCVNPYLTQSSRSPGHCSPAQTACPPPLGLVTSLSWVSHHLPPWLFWAPFGMSAFTIPLRWTILQALSCPLLFTVSFSFIYYRESVRAGAGEETRERDKQTPC